MPRKLQGPGGIDLRRLPIIRLRKLGRRQAHGLAEHPHFVETERVTHPVIEIDPRRKGRKRLDTILHETLHLAIPGLPEENVKWAATYQALVLWHLGYHADEDAMDENYAHPAPPK